MADPTTEMEDEVAQLRAEVKQLRKWRDENGGTVANASGWRAFRDMVCGALEMDPTWSTAPVNRIVALRGRAEKAESELAAARIALNGIVPITKSTIRQLEELKAIFFGGE